MKLRALLVEDCAAMRKMLMKMLPLTGLAEFQFTEAEDGIEALAKFDPTKVDIVFADWKMPRLTGIDFVRKVRASGKADHIPIVMVTGENTMGSVEEALDGARADLYITKPYTVDELRKRLAKLIDRMAAERCEHPAPERPGFLRWVLGDLG
jgi:two-component system, chemotaxis family, chemotaxis protein CheY